jgi:hypothetical protein
VRTPGGHSSGLLRDFHKSLLNELRRSRHGIRVGASWVPQDNSAWHGFAKMAEEHEQIPHAIESGSSRIAVPPTEAGQ